MQSFLSQTLARNRICCTDPAMVMLDVWNEGKTLKKDEVGGKEESSEEGERTFPWRGLRGSTRGLEEGKEDSAEGIRYR